MARGVRRPIQSLTNPSLSIRQQIVNADQSQSRARQTGAGLPLQQRQHLGALLTRSHQNGGCPVHPGAAAPANTVALR